MTLTRPHRFHQIKASHRAARLTFLQQQLRVSVFAFDYRGYGRSEGVPTIEGMLQDARAARDWLCERERLQPADLILMGRSLGGAVAVQLATETGARGLILESTFPSLAEAAAIHFPKALVRKTVGDQLDSVTAIRQYRGPLLQNHGTADEVIPFSLGKKLFVAAGQPKKFIAIAGGEHNSPPTVDYLLELDRFVDALPVARIGSPIGVGHRLDHSGVSLEGPEAATALLGLSSAPGMVR